MIHFRQEAFKTSAIFKLIILYTYFYLVVYVWYIQYTCTAVLLISCIYVKVKRNEKKMGPLFIETM